MVFTDFQFLEHRICINKISVPFTSPLSVTVGHLRIRFHGEGHRSIADRRLHMFLMIQVSKRCMLSVIFFHKLVSFAKMVNLF